MIVRQATVARGGPTESRELSVEAEGAYRKDGLWCPAYKVDASPAHLAQTVRLLKSPMGSQRQRWAHGRWMRCREREKKRAEPETEDVLLVQPVLGVGKRSECLPTVVANHEDPDCSSVVVRA